MDLDELKRLLEKATPGPWEAAEGNFITSEALGVVAEAPCQGANDDDLPAIIALRNTAPQLIQELEAAQERIAQLTAGQDALKQQTVRIRLAALGGQEDPGGDTEEIVRQLQARARELEPDAERYREVRRDPAMLLHLKNSEFDAAVDGRIAARKTEWDTTDGWSQS